MNFSDFQPSGSIGKGYFAEVLTGKMPNSDQPVVIKRLLSQHSANAEYRERFQREIAITKTLSSIPGVIKVLHENTRTDRPYYVMPRAVRSLHEYIKNNNQKLTPIDRVNICLTIASVIGRAHKEGTLHRDISPTNVLVMNENPIELAVCDFGLGKSKTQLGAMTASSVSGYGQILYVSPEQREKLKDADERSDIYSLGRLIDFVMTGRDPDNAESHTLSSVTSKATRRDPATRSQSVEEMVQAISSRLSVLNASAKPAVISLRTLATAVPPFVWDEVHLAITTGKYNGLAYQGYLNPVTTFFEKNDRVVDYCDAVGTRHHVFMDRYLSEITQASTEVGWPFKAVSSFHSIIKNMIASTADPSSIASGFAYLWQEACPRDQWSAQRELVELFQSATSEKIHEYAAVIEEAGEVTVPPKVYSAAPTLIQSVIDNF